MSGYVPALDGLRALAILLVLLSHFGIAAAPGLFGVTIFFFISGYLITGQLLAELDRTGRIAILPFFVRRALRLYPALLLMVPVATTLFVAAGGHVSIAETAAALSYTVNLREIWHPLESGLPGTPHPFGVLWSLAVEEHFYLVFPFATLLLARSRRTFVLLLLAAITATTMWRVHVAAGCEATTCTAYRVEHGTDTRIDSILFGALLAAVLASPWRSTTVRYFTTKAAPTVGAGLLLLCLLVRDPAFRTTARFTLQGIGLLLTVGALLHSPALSAWRRWAGHPIATTLGRWSYSLYLWHWTVLCLAIPLLPPALAHPLVIPGLPSALWLLTVFLPLTTLSLTLAAVSYYGVERPMLHFRRRWGSHAIADAPPSKTSALAMATPGR